MTYQEKVVVSAYTGFLMCDVGDMHRYIEEKMGRPVWTHEMRSSNTEFLEELRRRVLPDFLAICNDRSAPNASANLPGAPAGNGEPAGEGEGVCGGDER